jgi:hypothetical protein
MLPTALPRFAALHREHTQAQSLSAAKQGQLQATGSWRRAAPDRVQQGVQLRWLQLGRCHRLYHLARQLTLMPAPFTHQARTWASPHRPPAGHKAWLKALPPPHAQAYHTNRTVQVLPEDHRLRTSTQAPPLLRHQRGRGAYLLRAVTPSPHLGVRPTHRTCPRRGGRLLWYRGGKVGWCRRGWRCHGSCCQVDCRISSRCSAGHQNAARRGHGRQGQP